MATMKAGSEVAFQTWVLNVAEFGGFRLSYHTHDSRRSQRGFPDLVLIREETDVYVPELVVAELKGEKTRVQPVQLQWLDAFRSLGIEAHLWRDPADRRAIEQRLLRPRRLKSTSLGVCPNCESSDVTESPAGVLACHANGCGATWSGIREPIRSVSEHNGQADPHVARRAHADVARERRRTYEAARANGVEPAELVRLAEARAGVAPVRDLAQRDFVQEAREELADCRNYLVWLAAQVDHWAHLAPHLAVALRTRIALALGVVAQLFEHVEQLRAMMADFRSAAA